MHMALLIIFMINLCSANEDWINQQNRVFIEDRIQYWGTGIDTQEDIALFKAKGMALKSIGEECGGFYSKDIVIRKLKVLKEMQNFRAFVHADIPYVSCSYSKTPMAKTNKDLENPKFVEAQKLYDSLLIEQYRQRSNVRRDSKAKEEILSHIKSFTKENDKKLLALDKRLTDLEVRPPQQINQTIIKQTYQMTPSQTSYKECMDEYYDLLDEAHRESLNNEGMHKGNLAYGNARNLSNKAMRKEWKCKEYQK